MRHSYQIRREPKTEEGFRTRLHIAPMGTGSQGAGSLLLLFSVCTFVLFDNIYQIWHEQLSRGEIFLQSRVCGCFVVVEDVRRFECPSSKMVGLQFSVRDAVVPR